MRENVRHTMYPSRIPLSQAGLVQVISIDVELVFVALTCVGGVGTESGLE